MNETNKTICRLCLAVGNNFSPLKVLSEEKLNVVIPELHLVPSTAFVVCIECKSLVEEFYKLKRIIQGTVPSKDHVCSICLVVIRGDKKEIRKDTGDDLFSSILEMCLPELGQDYIEKIVMCELCYDTLRNFYFFKHKCLSVHKKIDLYYKFESDKNINLSEVLQFMSEDLANPVSLSDFEVADEDDGDSNSSDEEEGANDGQNVSGSHEGDRRGSREVDNEEPHEADDNNDDDQMSNASDEPPNKKTKKDPKRVLSDGLPTYHLFPPHVLQPRRGGTMDDWLERVEEIKQENNWTPEFAKKKVLKRLTTLKDMYSWFENLARQMHWEEFKEMLILAFPGTKDFAHNIRHVLNIRRVLRVRYVEFYHKKMKLLERIKVTDEEAVSLILDGVANARVNSAARIGDYRTPAELLKYFEKCDVEYPVKSRSFRYFRSKKKKTCSKCGNKGHLADKCKTGKFLQKEIKRNEENPRYMGKNRQNKEPEYKTQVICPRCNEKGHVYLQCPQVKDTVKKKLEREAGRKEKPYPYATPEESFPRYASDVMWKKVVDERRPPAGRECKRCKKAGHLESDCPMVLRNAASKSSLPRCSICDGVGHKSLNCPSVAPKKSVDGRIHPQTEVGSSDGRIGRGAEVKRQLEQNCSFCKSVGHSEHNCPEKRAQPYSNRSSVCLICQSERHTSSNCPQLKTPQNPTSFRSPEKTAEEYAEYRSRETYSNRDSDRYNANGAANATDYDTQIRQQELRSTMYNSYSSNSREVQEAARFQQCVRCGKIGHSSSQCPQYVCTQLSLRTSQCLTCGKFGHKPSDCSLIKRSSGKSIFNFQSRYNSSSSSSTGLSSLHPSESYTSRYRN